MSLNGKKVNLFIVGAPRCGTTSLYYYLSKHHEVLMSEIKEPNFFSNVLPKKNIASSEKLKKKSHKFNIISDIEIYNSLFSKLKNQSVIGEASPTYLFDESSAKKIFQYNPEAKIIILLREPIERAYSHFLMERAEGNESSSDFVKVAIQEFTDGKNTFGDNPLYIKLGLYYEQIERYYKLFPENQIKIIKSSDLKDNTLFYLEEIGKFLNIDANFFKLIQTPKLNITKIPKNFVVKKLFEFYNNHLISYYLKGIQFLEIKHFIKIFFFEKKSEVHSVPENYKIELLSYFELSNRLLFEKYKINF